MNQAERAGRELRAMDDLAAQDSFLHRLSPLSKLFVTIFYLAVVVSFPRYRLTALVWMALFPVAGYQLAGIALRTCFQKLRLVLPLVCAVGLLNPIFDRQIVTQIGLQQIVRYRSVEETLGKGRRLLSATHGEVAQGYLIVLHVGTHQRDVAAP